MRIIHLTSGIAILLSFNLVTEHQAAPLKGTQKTQKGNDLLMWRRKISSLSYPTMLRGSHKRSAKLDNQKRFVRGKQRRKGAVAISKTDTQRSFLGAPWFHEWIPCGNVYGDWFGQPCSSCDCTGGQYENPGCDCTGGQYENPGCDCTGQQYESPGCDCTGGLYEYPGCCCCDHPWLYPSIPCCCCGGPMNAEENKAAGHAVTTPVPVISAEPKPFDKAQKSK